MWYDLLPGMLLNSAFCSQRTSFHAPVRGTDTDSSYEQIFKPQNNFARNNFNN